MRKGFLWGVATSAHQIEGARDQRSDSIWDRFSETPGKIADGYRADIGCDHYHRWREDIALMKDLGVNSTRFSVSWPRVEPSEGVGGDLEFYDRLVDAYLEAGIDPMVHLFHWDFPLWAEDNGGWNDPRTPVRFGHYARRIAEKLGDRVSRWLSFNEPNCFIGDGLMGTVHAPGHGWDWERGATAIRTFFRSHRAAMAEIRSARADAKISVALTGPIWCPAEESPEAIKAARTKTFGIDQKNLWTFGLWSDPLLGGRWDRSVLTMIPELECCFEDEPPIPADFVCLNLYSGGYVNADGTEKPKGPGFPVTAFNWPVTPQIARWGPTFFHERYGLEILVGENGMAGLDWISLDGEVQDPQRSDFIERHLLELARAARAGVPIMGYHHWTLLDNFEWQEGFRKRFGLVYVDFETGQRTPKQSFSTYRKHVRHRWGWWHSKKGPLP